jgi:serine/threonine protein kinase
MGVDRIGRYKIVGELGRGAMGVVYHAIDPNIGRPVAIKTIRLSDVRNEQEQTKLRERLFREARSAGMLSHPGIVTIYDVEQQDDIAYIAMEFVDGPTLDDMLAGGPPLTGEQMFGILAQTAVALDYAHSKGIVHRDIKPANIMVTGNGTAKITDFGIAKINTSEQFTMTGTIVGTPHYMSPEQVQGKPVDGRSDQFSLAVVAYEMLTGEKPFTGDHLTTVVYKIVAEEAQSITRLNPTLSAAIEAILRRGLAKKPDQRFKKCTEFVEALEKACAATRGWKALVRGGSLDMPTLADGPHPQQSIVLPPSARSRRAQAELNEETAQTKRSGFLPFLFAILVAAGLLALIGWQAAPWLAQRTQNGFGTKTGTPAQPKPPATPPASQPTVPVNPQEQRPSALPPSSPAPAAVPAATPEKLPESAAAAAKPVETAEAPPPVRPKPRPAPSTPAVSRPPSETVRRQPFSRTSSVSIATIPGGAVVALDGRPGASCRTPCSLDATAGRHSLTITLAGHYPEVREITVSAGPLDVGPISLRLAGGTVMVSSVPPGATITINGHQWNRVTPAQVSLAPGNYTVTVEKDGKRATGRVDVRAGGLSPLKLYLE